MDRGGLDVKTRECKRAEQGENMEKEPITKTTLMGVWARACAYVHDARDRVK